MSAITALMKLWPTFVRTGVPPRSRTTSGTAFEQMQLWRIVAPGCFSRTPAATMAVVVEPEIGAPVSSTRNTRSASPSKASPTSAPDLEDAGLEVAQVLRLDRVGGMVRERAVELAVQQVQLEGQAVEHHRHHQPPMPLAVSATTFSGRSAPTSTKERTCSAKARSRSSDSSPPAGPGGAARRARSCP